jgi:hypothetical protein
MNGTEPKQPIEYMVFKQDQIADIDHFSQQVTELLREGWKLHGGTFVNQGGRMCQALTRGIE